MNLGTLVFGTFLGLLLVGCSAEEPTPQKVVIIATNPTEIESISTGGVDATRVLTLEEEQSLTFFDLAGERHMLTGPYNGTIEAAVSLPTSSTASEQMLASVEEYLKPARGLKRTAGATRGDADIGPWDLSISDFSDGDVFCIPRNGEFDIIRRVSGFDSGVELALLPEGRETLIYSFEPTVSSIKVDASEVLDGSYTISVDGDQAGVVAIKSIPNVDKISFSALNFHKYDCVQQFERVLISSYP